jgi:hypothetical protein
MEYLQSNAAGDHQVVRPDDRLASSAVLCGRRERQ